MAIAEQHHRQNLIQQAEKQTALQLLLSRGVCLMSHTKNTTHSTTQPKQLYIALLYLIRNSCRQFAELPSNQVYARIKVLRSSPSFALAGQWDCMLDITTNHNFNEHNKVSKAPELMGRAQTQNLISQEQLCPQE